MNLKIKQSVSIFYIGNRTTYILWIYKDFSRISCRKRHIKTIKRIFKNLIFTCYTTHYSAIINEEYKPYIGALILGARPSLILRRMKDDGLIC